MKGFDLPELLISAVVIGIVVLLTVTPIARPIKSLEETYGLMDQLGLRWDRSGVPVIVFASDGCPASRSLEAALQREGVVYLRVDVHGSELAGEIHADLGRNRLGTVATRATPTIVVGTRVLRGDDVEAVMEAIASENE